MIEIKPCPFCEGVNVSCEAVEMALYATWAVMCSDCSSRGPEDDTEPEAITRWNAAHIRMLEAMRDQRHACAEAVNDALGSLVNEVAARCGGVQNEIMNAEVTTDDQ